MHNKTRRELEYEEAEIRLRRQMIELRLLLEREILIKRYELLGEHINFAFKANFNPDQPRNVTGQWTDSGNAEPEDKPVTEPTVKPEAKPVAKPGAKPAKEFSTSGKGANFIKKREGFRKKEYLDSNGHRTIGFGHKLQKEEKYPDGITEKEALKLFAKDVIIAETDIKDNVKVELTQNQFDALLIPV